MATMTKWKVQLFKLNYDQREKQAVSDVLDSGWITMGQKTIDFENAFSSYLGEGVQSIAVANGTAALHIAVLALGIKAGDEVIVPSQTFIADLNAVRVCGAIPVLADITNESDWSMDPIDIESKITEKTRAILIVHYAGYACDMDAIMKICEKYKLPLIEDCAHAPGADYKEKKLGTFGDVSAWSFFSNKNMSCGEGGMVVVKDPALYQSCKNLRSHGMTVASFDRMKGRAVSYDILSPGFNYRMDEIRAALGLVQLDKLPESNGRRKELTQRYFKNLSGIPQITLPFKYFNRGEASYHIMPILLDANLDRALIIDKMREDGVQTSIHYPAIQGFTAYKDIVGETPKAMLVSMRELTLPLYPTMTDSEVDLVCQSLIQAIGSGKVG